MNRYGLIDSPERGLPAGHEARRQDVDFLVLYVTTYALSSTVLPLVRRAKVPVLVLNLQPEAAIDYKRFNALPGRRQMTAEWLAYCSACPVPELANVFGRAGIPFHQVTGVLHDDPECWLQIHEWLDAARVVHTLSHTRLGLMGHYYSGMLDVATDLVQVCATFGTHIEIVEIDELSHLRRSVTNEQMERQLSSIAQSFNVESDCSRDELKRAARTSAALEQFAEIHSLGARAYFYKGSGAEQNEETITSIILGASLLTSRGIPVAGEYEIKNALAMKIMDSFGTGGSFTEYYAIDFIDHVVLMGHDGPGHAGIAEGKTKVRPLQVYHGKIGRGLSVEMSVKTGPVTLLSIVESKDHGFKLLFAEGQTVAGPILEIGNTNSRYRFPIGAGTSSIAGTSRHPRTIVPSGSDTSEANSKSSRYYLALRRHVFVESGSELRTNATTGLIQPLGCHSRLHWSSKLSPTTNWALTFFIARYRRDNEVQRAPLHP